jgi:hypothetical protein
MLNKYILDDPLFEFRQVGKIISAPKIETGSEPPASYLVGTRGFAFGVKGAGR